MTVCECFSDDQLRSFQRAFNHYDKGKTGVLSLEDFPKALKIIGIVPTQEELKGMEIDLGNAQLDVIEFISLIYYFLRGSDTRDELIKAFAVFDEDHDGKIPVDRVTQILTNLKHPVPKEQVDEVIAQLEVDESNLIDYADMIRILRPE